MADCVVTFLLQNLTQLLSQESKLLGGVEDQVRLLQNELSLMNVFLQNTEGKRHDNELVKKVVSQIRDVAYEAEDVIDIVNVYCVMGFRPNYFTCTTHLYLYYTLLVPHTYASYIRH